MEAAVRRGHFPLLILEDDAVPVGTFDLAAAFASAPAGAGLLYFGALPVRDRKRVRGFCTRRRGWGRTDIQLYGGHAYGIPDADAARHLIAFAKTHRMTYDSALIRYRKAFPDRVAVHCPFLFVQSAGVSDIEGVERPQRGS
jgi:hypothetical protein